MKFTLSWLDDHLNTFLPATVLAERLTQLGLEVESMLDLGANLHDIRVAKIVTAVQHPNADRLRVCTVDVGDPQNPVTVVCGAPNAAAGLMTAFIAPSVVVPATGQALKAAVIRGQESQGMLASATELQLTDPRLLNDGIVDLRDFTCSPGQSLAKVLGLNDTLIDLAVTPNRGDCLSVRGIARELAAAGCGRLVPLPTYQIHEDFKTNRSCDREANAADKVPFLSFREIKGINGAETPAWIKQRLTAIGCSLNNLAVDVANYVMFDLGQPLHAYDAETVKGNLIARAAAVADNTAAAFTALNQNTYTIPSSALLITDDQGAVAIAGVMGSQGSRCTPETQHIVLEAGIFHHAAIAQAGQTLGLLSDARYRFERKVDPAMVQIARDYAAYLIQSACEGATVSQAVACGALPLKAQAILLSSDAIGHRLGFTPPGIPETLRFLGCEVDDCTSSSSPGWSVVPPTWRHDLTGPEDLCEEVLRIVGYDKLPALTLSRPNKPLQYHGNSMRLAQCLAARGLHEAKTWSFISAQHAAWWGQNLTDLTLVNPISQEMAIMRPSLLPQLLEATARNHHRGQKSVGLFELGNTHHLPAGEHEKTMIAMVRSGLAAHADWQQKARPITVFDIKADVEALMSTCGMAIDDLTLSATDLPPFLHPGRAAWLVDSDGYTVGLWGQLHPQTAQALDLHDVNCCVAELDCAWLARAAVTQSARKKSHAERLKLSSFPSVERDFAFIVPADIAAGHVSKAVRAVDDRITHVKIFDVYQGTGIPEGRKSVAIRLTLVSHDATFDDTTLQSISQAVIDAVASTCQGELRGV